LEEAFAAAIGGVRLWEDQEAELFLRATTETGRQQPVDLLPE
jgi:hypothetical protein